VAIELTPELLQLAERAWAEQQAGALTVETAHAVQQAITEHAKVIDKNRYEVEAALKRAVRHPEPTGA
jgi:hypothetical protein